MDEKLRGAFPGGPSHRPTGDRDEHPRIRRMAELEARIEERARDVTGRARRRRTAVGWVVTLAVAGALGLLVGIHSRRSAEETAGPRDDGTVTDRTLVRDVNRALIELGKAEDTEGHRVPQ